MNAIEKIQSVFSRKHPRSGNPEMAGNVLSIDCRGCGHVPDARSTDCVRCMVSGISECGNADRIRLRTGRDIEVSGTASDILCDMAFLERSMRSISAPSGEHRCRNCGFSPKEIFTEAWAGFPDPSFDRARSKLASFRPEDGGCDHCIRKTYRALDQAELGFDGIRRKTSSEAENGGM